MDTARLLKTLANLLVGAGMIKLVAIDVAATARQDAALAARRTNSAVAANPYRAASVAIVVGFLGGILLGRRP
jgi:ElaB/YqjD/DUF883 family membrane-anchored ribosome-binding protein